VAVRAAVVLAVEVQAATHLFLGLRRFLRLRLLVVAAVALAVEAQV
jgi:hypothetical protein